VIDLVGVNPAFRSGRMAQFRSRSPWICPVGTRCSPNAPKIRRALIAVDSAQCRLPGRIARRRVQDQRRVTDAGDSNWRPADPLAAARMAIAAHGPAAVGTRRAAATRRRIVRLPQAIGFWEGWDSRFTCQFVESRAAGRHAQAQNRGVGSAGQSGRRRHRGWRTTPKARQAGKTWVAAIATPRSAPR
jgi:hypothetical protein